MRVAERVDITVSHNLSERWTRIGAGPATTYLLQAIVDKPLVVGPIPIRLGQATQDSKETSRRVMERPRPRTSDVGVVAAPLPISRVLTEPGANGIEIDVLRNTTRGTRSEQRNVREPPEEDVSCGLVPLVPTLPEQPVQSVHSTVEVRLVQPDQQVVVIRHENPVSDRPVEALGHVYK